MGVMGSLWGGSMSASRNSVITPGRCEAGPPGHVGGAESSDHMKGSNCVAFTWMHLCQLLWINFDTLMNKRSG